MKYFRLNMAAFGVKVLCIEPGFFKTNVTDSAILSKNVQMLWDRLPQEVKDDYGTEYMTKGKFASSYFHPMRFNSHIYFFILLIFSPQCKCL